MKKIRPVRVEVRDSEGRRVTLAGEREGFLWLAGEMAAPVLVMGLGKGIAGDALEELNPDTVAGASVYWLDAPEMLKQSGSPVLPEHWKAVSPEQAKALLPVAHILWFRQNIRLFPEFWGELYGLLLCRQTGIRTAARQNDIKNYFSSVTSTDCHENSGEISAGDGNTETSALLQRTGADASALPGHPCQAPSPPPVQAAVPPAPSPAPPESPLVILPGRDGDLLTRELNLAFSEAGWRVIVLPPEPEAAGAGLTGLLERRTPALYFSVNLRGLSADILYLLEACHVRAAVWFVDNPWHILSGVRTSWWKKLHCFVTDESFLPSLRASGARADFLPLAASQTMIAAGEQGKNLGKQGGVTGDSGRITKTSGSPVGKLKKSGEPGRTAGGAAWPVLFVGSSAFPGKKEFFAAAKLPEALSAEGMELLRSGGRPDFFWWQERLGVQFWPGHAIRRAGLGAEECSLARRAAWLQAAGPGLRVYGDNGWRGLLPPGAEWHPPVNYYTELPALYHNAAITLNITSLLLPHGLTQRHFDVWAAGGFLLSDATPGLSLFPDELVRPIIPSVTGGAEPAGRGLSGQRTEAVDGKMPENRASVTGAAAPWGGIIREYINILSKGESLPEGANGTCAAETGEVAAGAAVMRPVIRAREQVAAGTGKMAAAAWLKETSGKTQSWRTALSEAWRTLILQEHTYTRRVEKICNNIFCSEKA